RCCGARRSGSRLVVITVQPLAARASTTARPIPEVPPVTRAVRSVCAISGLLPCRCRGREEATDPQTGEDAPAEERSLQGVVAVHAAPAEAGDLTGGEEPGDRCPCRPDDLSVEVRLEPAEGLAREQTQPHRDQRSVRRIEDPMGPDGPDDLVAEVGPGIVDRLDLRVLGEGVVGLPVALPDL